MSRISQVYVAAQAAGSRVDVVPTEFEGTSKGGGMSGAMAPAGWYPDAQTPDTLRWWDGREWTAHTPRAICRDARSAGG